MLLNTAVGAGFTKARKMVLGDDSSDASRFPRTPFSTLGPNGLNKKTTRFPGGKR
jgi:hypothetical protein